jgi:formylglycine-generating enzyme required for sulfatase activity
MFYRLVALGTLVHPPAGMAYIAPGEVLMGDNFGLASDALPVHPVAVSAFFIDRYEVSLSLWNEVSSWAKLHGYGFENPGYAAATNHPANGIDWYDAVKWCNARSEKAGIAPVYFTDGSRTVVYRTGRLDLAANCVNWSGSGYRLPTEAEWEKAARGGLAGQHYPWPSGGSDYSTQVRGEQANFWNSGDPCDNGTTPVGFYDGHQSVTGQDMANGFGLYDMAGNVDEMCWDWHGVYPPGAQTDPRGAERGDRRVARGGSWYNYAFELRCSARRPVWPGMAGAQSGFRCVQNAVPY